MKRLPLDGPKPLSTNERPHCRWCGKPLKPAIWKEFANGFARPATRRYFAGVYGEHNLFCGKNCAAKWAFANAKLVVPYYSDKEPR